MEVQVNYLAVFLAAAASMVIGSIWYSMGVFGKTWVKLARLDMSKPVEPTKFAVLIASVFAAALITAYILAHVAFLSHQFFQNSFMQDSVITGFWLWLGFTAARIYTHDAFESRPKLLTAITFGNEFVTIMVMATIIGALGL